ncbi:hypothetical protein CH254_18050 [Rhodococcus sp. 06-412-2C]|uniref:hypothetical protein n=1 Tax=unclassified Rhodococcus (in: high G+C Gram-positive bacteria) TaxID=192944 RepID=UPI000B9BDE60|nr:MULTISPECIES: hypothetical protein [unclassified Rhodococcus (in: high G+C Gram-positive bacteria)]OZC86605.1 hypothetical protein CH254_18050 [Rhodococcus sp. 06-412-2C]OZD02308.1 hypothetical protein CH279_04235 [Rhodococcus sp. 06-412-2B]
MAGTALAETRNSARARVGSLSRSRTPEDPDLVKARRDLAAGQLAHHIEKVLSVAPPLSIDQRAELAALFEAGRAEVGIG